MTGLVGLKVVYVDATTMVRMATRAEVAASKLEYTKARCYSPLLFIIVLEALSGKLKGGPPWELLYADDLVLMAETDDLL